MQPIVRFLYFLQLPHVIGMLIRREATPQKGTNITVGKAQDCDNLPACHRDYSTSSSSSSSRRRRRRQFTLGKRRWTKTEDFREGQVAYRDDKAGELPPGPALLILGTKKEDFPEGQFACPGKKG